MTASGLPDGEIAVLGLARSGTSVAKLLVANGRRVYVSDAAETDEVRARADELRRIGADVQTGGHDPGRIARAGLVVVSPGIPPEAEAVASAREAGVAVSSEIDVALRFLQRSRIIAVTGTNGKTTTTALISHLLRGVGGSAIAAGNIGMPLSEVALLPDQPEWVALEISSFQLHDTEALAPQVGVVTNLSPDHLDRYASADGYFADKARLFRNAVGASRWVLNADDEALRGMTRDTAGTKLFFSVLERADAWLERESGTLYLGDRALARRESLPLIGEHNVANALAAALAVTAADPAFSTDSSLGRIRVSLESFRGLPHRLELIGEIRGVQWINDSKATNVSSTRVALNGMTRPTVLLLGGRHKGEAYLPLVEGISKTVRVVLAFGEAAPLIEQDLAPFVTVERLDGSFDEVVRRARELARPGEAVLLSPACSSFDMFRNYEERGTRFRALAMES